ncbi:MAG TPA: hypothetical protein VM925_10485 [Labilithrix sp.]|nr:hypothetical protein [Labilithrix sp.]
MLENEIAAAQQSHPGITEVDVAGVSAFHGAAKTNVLRPGLEWYLASTGAPSIAVSEIKGALVAAVKPVVEASVVREAYEDGQWYGYVNPVKLMYREDVPRDFYVVAQKAGVEVALRDVTAPSGVDVKSLLTNAAAQWELLLPVKVSTKPTFLQLGNIFHMDLGKVVTDDKAFAEIDNFDPALLAPLKARPQSIKAAWYFTSRNLNTFGVEDHGLIFMDEHKQVWGFYLQVPIE